MQQFLRHADVHTPSRVSVSYTERISPKGRAAGSEISVQTGDRESRAEGKTYKCLLHPAALASHFPAKFPKEPAGLGMRPAETCLLY